MDFLAPPDAASHDEEWSPGSTGTVHNVLHVKYRVASGLDNIDYNNLAGEHQELLANWESPQKIATWIWEKLGIEKWAYEEFYGDREVLSTPESEEGVTRLKKFVEALGVTWTGANGPSENHPQYLLLDGFVQTALFGDHSRQEVSDTFELLQGMWRKHSGKIGLEILGKEIGLENAEWGSFTGCRWENGESYHNDQVWISGKIQGDGPGIDYLKLFQKSPRAGHGQIGASIGQLCFLNTKPISWEIYA